MDLQVPMGKGEGGSYTLKIKAWMRDIMYGREAHPWAVVVDERE